MVYLKTNNSRRIVVPKKKKKAKKKLYFGMEVQDAIVRYNDLDPNNDSVKRNKIYQEEIHAAFDKLSENIIDTAKLNDLDQNAKTIIENSEKSLFDLAERGSFSSSLVKFDEAMKLTIEMASNAYKNDEAKKTKALKKIAKFKKINNWLNLLTR